MPSMRQQIIDALATRLKTILAGASVTLNGDSYTYATDIGAVVTVWRKEELRQDETWFLNLRDTKAPKDPAGEGSEVGRTLHRLQVLIDMGVKDSMAPELIRAALLDVSVCLGANRTLGGLCRNIDIDDDSLGVDETGQLIAGASLSLTITYRTPLWRM